MAIQRILWPTETPTALRAALDKFASEVQRYVGVLPNVDSLPASGDFTGQTLLNTTDNTAYMWNSTEWIQLVDLTWLGVKVLDAQMEGVAASKITGQLTAAQIEGIEAAQLTTQITETMIADNAITTPKIAAGAVTANEIAANTITANQIAAYTITGNEIFGNTITGAKIAAGAISAVEIAAATIAGSNIAAYTIEAGNIKANTITAAEISTSYLYAGSLNANQVTTGTLGANVIYTGTLAANKILAGTLNSGVLNTGTMNANLITAGTLGASVIYSGTVAANNIIAGTLASNVHVSGTVLSGAVIACNISGDRINAGYINAGTINAGLLLQGTMPVARLATYSVTNLYIGTGSGGMGSLNIQSGVIGNAHIDTLDASNITTGTLGANVIYTGTLAANKIVAGTLNSGVLNTGTMNANLITAGTLGASVIYTGTLAANKILAGTLNSGVINTGTMSAGLIVSGTMLADRILGGAIGACSLAAGTIAAAQVNALDLNVLGRFRSNNGSMLSVSGAYLSSGLTTQYPTSSNFTDDGQFHVYNWVSGTWVENCRIGNGVYDTDNVTAYFVNRTGNNSCVEAWRTGTGAGYAVAAYNTAGVGAGVCAWGPVGLYAYGNPAIDAHATSSGYGGKFYRGSSGPAALVIVADAAATNPSWSADKGSLHVTSEGHLWINTNGSTGWAEVYPQSFTDNDSCATVVCGGSSGSAAYGDMTHVHIAGSNATAAGVFDFDATSTTSYEKVYYLGGVSGGGTCTIAYVTSGDVTRYSISLTLGSGTHFVIARVSCQTYDGGTTFNWGMSAHAIRTA